ncbi:AraC family transcriptional regulator [Flavobacterium sedimenticola]|uniref:Helix-turn-helix transcriptional regulator n=1 Tax=Flavobacterium sedimenticola TaxID=3043286 RepID=A0ABT6XNX4_9FLAO|nr:helix-turn-helix transcriptional regulator [Flavobacterium sedimenticola]MDI9256795.1 helix-turn-helix transcriptional regulator [Flavobacterium sedimenticola]
MKNIPVKQLHECTKEPQLTGNFSIRAIEILMEEEELVQELHRHDFYFIIFLTKGSGRHEIDFVNYPVTDCSVAVMRPGQVHQLVLSKESRGYILQFKTDFLYSHNSASQNHLTKVSQKNYYSFEPEGFRKMEELLANIARESNRKAKGYLEVMKAHLSVLLIELLRQQKETEKSPAVKGNPYAQEKLETFMALVAQHSITHKQLPFYTNHLHLSAYQLSAITKTLLHKTPSEIINEYLILEAKRQLLATSNQVSQIAFHLGYEDPSYFIRFFKKHTGQTPESFRQNLK